MPTTKEEKIEELKEIFSVCKKIDYLVDRKTCADLLLKMEENEILRERLFEMRGRLFELATRLSRIADSIEELK